MSDSVLDLLLEDTGYGDVVLFMQVDSHSKLLSGRDHMSLLFEVNALSMTKNQEEDFEYQTRGLSLEKANALREMLETLIMGLYLNSGHSR